MSNEELFQQFLQANAQIIEIFQQNVKAAIDEHFAAGHSIFIFKDGRIQEIFPPTNKINQSK